MKDEPHLYLSLEFGHLFLHFTAFQVGSEFAEQKEPIPGAKEQPTSDVSLQNRQTTSKKYLNVTCYNLMVKCSENYCC